ncbi:MAG: TIGR01459 family HAD-type hydrolase [Alphaproteobacteria bacterium]
MTKILNGINDILQKYDLAIIDQWGVLHNGMKPFQGAVEAISALYSSGTKIIILSNSGKLAKHSEKLIAHMGFDMGAIHKVISSGEAARQWLIDKKDPLSKKLAEKDDKKLLFWGFDNDHKAIDGLGFTIVDDINMVDVILAAGTERGNLAAYKDEMDIGLARGIPMLCTNPDLVANMPDGSLKICPGTLAEYYENHKGRVVRFGKPSPKVYDMCKQEFPEAKKIIGIGDSLDHDIMGANCSGMDSLFILGGIHQAEFYNGSDPKVMKKLFTIHGATPTFALDSFHL